MKIKSLVLFLLALSLTFGVYSPTRFPNGLEISETLSINATTMGGGGTLAINATTVALTSTLTAGGDVSFNSSTTTEPEVHLNNTNADGNAATLIFQKNSTSPADNDEIGNVEYRADDDAGAINTYGSIIMTQTGTNAASDSGKMYFSVMDAGTIRNMIEIDPTNNLTSINKDGIDQDFVIEGDADANLFVVNAGDNDEGVGIGKALTNITASLDVQGSVSANTILANSTMTLQGTAANVALGANYIGRTGTDAGLSVDADNKLAASAGLGITGTLTMNASASNVALGSNYISNGGTDAGLSVDADNKLAASAGVGITGTLTMNSAASNVALGSNYISNGGTDAGMSVNADNEVTFAQGLVASDTITASVGLVVNEGGTAVNTRIETDGSENAFFIDGDSGNIGIGHASPAVTLDVEGTVSASAMQCNGIITVADTLQLTAAKHIDFPGAVLIGTAPSLAAHVSTFIAGYGTGLVASSTAYNNVIIGSGTGVLLAGDDGNVIIGAEAGAAVVDGSSNTLVGWQAGMALSTSDAANVMLGAQAGKYETVGSKLYIDSIDRTDEATARTNSLIYGVMNSTVANQTLALNAGTVTITGTVSSNVARCISINVAEVIGLTKIATPDSSVDGTLFYDAMSGLLTFDDDGTWVRIDVSAL